MRVILANAYFVLSQPLSTSTEEFTTMEIKATIARSVDNAHRLARAVQTHDPSVLEPRQQKAFWVFSRTVVQLSLITILLDQSIHRIKHGRFWLS
ncbi:hypothetical protein TFLX_01825 [Thermoflexales bacterium]|nr:hypothetical protein TFLX_01825 [Thermoflexales bacterium]